MPAPWLMLGRHLQHKGKPDGLQRVRESLHRDGGGVAESQGAAACSTATSQRRTNYARGSPPTSVVVLSGWRLQRCVPRDLYGVQRWRRARARAQPDGRVPPAIPAVLQALRDLQKEGTMHTLDTLQKESTVTRRRFVAFIGWGSFAAFWGSIVLVTLRFLFPRILYEPSPLFQAGKPDDYQIGEVSTRFKEAQRVWIIRTTDGLYALIAICTHLGCTPIWHTMEERFKCPCHGSNFLRDGTNVAGPAPVPLYRAAIGLDVTGILLVDKSQRENQPGKRDKPPFFLPLLGLGRAAA